MYVAMFGYTVPLYTKLSPADTSLYRRYYCEGCHQLKAGFGLTGTLTVNFDMTFNTILLCGLTGGPLEVEGNKGPVCVFDRPKTDSELMRGMAAYTLILTKWEIEDDLEDKPSVKSKFIDLALGRAIDKAVRLYPQYDDMVGKGFEELRRLERSGCKDARLMGRTFGKSLVGALDDFAGDHGSDDLRELFTELSTAVYIMDAIDDLDDDFMDGTYNPLLPDRGFVNSRDLINRNLFEFTDLVNGTVSGLQGSYSRIRPEMKGNVSLCDNIVYYGIPASARKVISGTTEAEASIKNVLSNRKARLSD